MYWSKSQSNCEQIVLDAMSVDVVCSIDRINGLSILSDTGNIYGQVRNSCKYECFIILWLDKGSLKKLNIFFYELIPYLGHSFPFNGNEV